jgi:ABC-type dipeptide/oligopeptide/nickel transport system permease component
MPPVLYLGQMLSANTSRSNWWGFIGKRVLIAGITFLIITMLVYVAFHGVWGPDNAENILKAVRTYKDLPVMDTLMAKYASGESRITQYLEWLGDFFTGEWVNSIIREVPVKDLLF